MVPRMPELVCQARRQCCEIQEASAPAQDSPCTPEEIDENEHSEQALQGRDLPFRNHRPVTPRNSTDPLLVVPPAANLHNDLTVAPSRPRNHSPYSRSHLRSRSGNATLAAPAMARTLSLPSERSTSHFSLSPSWSPSPASSSPQRSPKRSGSPFRSQPAEFHPQPSMSPQLYDGGFEIISEESVLDLTPRATADRIARSPSPLYNGLNSSRSLATRKQRPSSPLNGFGTPAHTTPVNTPLSSSSSPSLGPMRFNEGFPTLHHYSSNSSFSSVPSTPSLARSRSPSISSLETIEDAPDAEYEAIENERMARFKAATESVSGEAESRRRSSLDIPGRTGAGFGFGRGAGQARKRWSICGGERRADLDLETIWED